MSEISNLNGNGTSTPFSAATEQTFTYINTVFQRLQPREVEQFYKSYHFWLLQRRIQTLYTEAAAVQQAIIDNNTLRQQVHLSAIALASLAQLQASGVSDLDLLDRMLERGEAWLDNTMQLLEHCEKLDVIRGDYTQWCEHALEGAYDWIASMEATEAINQLEYDAINDEQQTRQHTATEEQLLQKLMSDEETTEKIAALHSLLSEARERTLEAHTRKITQPLDQPEATNLEALTRKITQPLDQPEPETTEAHTRKITQPLDQSEALIETELPAETVASAEMEQVESTNSASDESILQPETPLPLEVDEDDTEQTNSMPALVLEQISETHSEVNAERSLDSNTLPDTSNQIIEEPHITHSEQIDTMEHVAEAPDEGFQESITQKATAEADDAIVSEEASAETATAVIVISKSPQENKKPQLQKVQRKGFWRLLNRLLAIILRR
jgi:hypothetical protein